MMSYYSHITKVLGLFILMLTFYSCQQEKSPQPLTSNKGNLKKSMEKANEMLVSLETEKINAFVLRYGWTIKQSGTGLRYYIYKTTKGVQPEKGDSVVIKFSVMLLNGQNLYSSVTDGPLIFQTGKGKTINGLEEGVFLLHVGEQAKFIVPSHLAFGLLGDQKKIPQRATLVYDVELTKVIKKQ